MTREYQGIPVSDGIAIARAVVLRPAEIQPDPTPIQPEQAQAELAAFAAALEAAREQIQALYDSTCRRLGEERAEIFSAHLSVLEDPVLEETIQDKITQDHRNAVCAIAQGVEEIAAMFQGLQDPYLQERAADIRDVGRRILENAAGVPRVELSSLEEDSVVIARDLTPSETVTMDLSHTMGFVTELGGRTSHTAILSRSLEIPAVVGVSGLLDHIAGGETVILDALEGRLLVDPTGDQVEDYRRRQSEFLAQRQALNALRDLPAQTRDGRVFSVGSLAYTVPLLEVLTNNG